ncbi:MAG: hypothetical protein K0R73_742 [Candidatus Midichloriaceae bacterium]|nr:hypothetical protein [Candidatus Midichloriaceae bacterium]
MKKENVLEQERRHLIESKKNLSEAISKLNAKENGVLIKKLKEDFHKKKQSYLNRVEEFRKDKPFKLNMNHYLICDALAEMARRIMTFYNHIPKTAFLKIDGFKAPSNESSKVRGALSYLKKSAAVDVNKDCDALFSLFFYPKITDTKALNAHIKSTKSLKPTLAQPRTNDLEDLHEIVARHLHIAFASFSKLEANKKVIVDLFVKEVNKGWDNKCKMWDILVRMGLNDLECIEKSYTNSSEYMDAASSDTPESFVTKSKSESQGRSNAK